MTCKHVLVTALPALLLLVAATAAGAATTLPFADGVVVDEGRGLAYVMSSRGGVDAIDLNTGAAVWHSDKAARPLAMVEERLLAQAEPSGRGRGIALVTLRLDGDGALEQSFTAPLPAHLTATVAERRGASFHLKPALTADGVLLHWTALNFPARGALWKERDGNTAARVEEGVVRVALPAGSRPVAEASDAATFRAAAAAGALAELPRSASGERRFRSADGWIELTSAARPGDDGRPRFSWRLADAASGRELGGVEMSRALMPFLVSAGRLLVVAAPEANAAGGRMVALPQRLAAYDAAAGTELWTVALRDLRFHGPLPP